jgi:hypothetical protein
MRKQGKKSENVCNIYFRLKRAFVSSSFVGRKDTWKNLFVTFVKLYEVIWK